MSNDGIPMSDEDMYGQRHPVENPDLIAAKLGELEEELSQLSDEDSQGWTQAKAKCSPDLINDDFKLMFLRCEVFNADLAAKRIGKYWNKRISVFGQDKAFLPMTLDGALKDDHISLGVGFARLVVPAKDPAGRSIIFADPSKLDSTKYDRESMVRATWYVMHAALESVDAQKMGVVMVAYPKHVHITQVDRKLMKLNMESIKGCIPVRLAAFQICHPPEIFSIIFPLIKLFLGERLRKRIKVHSGSDEHVLEQLSKYGLTKDCLPTELGGAIVLDHDNWLSERKSSSL
jgi:hypothetical protein